jgi:hypothetical protein
MTKYLVGVFLVLILIIAVSAPDRPGEAVEFTIITPEYRATPGEVALSSGFNEVVNAQIDNVDAIATAVQPIFDFWNSAAMATPGNVVYGAEGNFGSLSITVSGTPTPGDQFWAGAVFDDYFELYSAFESGSYWTYNLYDAHTEPRVTCIKVIPTAGVVEIFGTPLVVTDPATPTPDPPIYVPTTKAVYWGLGSTATGARSTAWGVSSSATGTNSTAWGEYAVASNTDSTAWGYESSASGPYSTAFGTAAASGSLSTAWGDATASGDYSTAWGLYTLASGLGSNAFGLDIAVSGAHSVGIGLEDVPTTTPTYSVAADNVFVVMGGKVGIGDTSPDYDLDVAGDINVTGNYYVGDVAIYTPTPLTTGTPATGDYPMWTGGTRAKWVTPVPPTPITVFPASSIMSLPVATGTPLAGGYLFCDGIAGSTYYKALPTAVPPTAVATPTPSIQTWGTATPVASAGDQRWNTDYQVMEQYNGSAWWPTGPLVQIDWAFYEKNPGDAFIFGSLDYGYPTTYYTTGPCLIYAVDASVSIAPGSGKGFTYTVSAAGTPIPSLAATITGTGNAGVDTCTYFYCAKNTAITIAITVTGTPDGSDAQHAIKLYAVRRP